MSNNKEKAGLKTGQLIALIVILILNLIWIVCSFIFAKGNITFSYVACIVMFAAAVFYTCYGYKVPHGNLMRYLLLFSAVYSAVQYVFGGIAYPKFIITVYFVIIILTAYLAGRLNRYTQGVIISILLLICRCVITVYFLTDVNGTGLEITFLNVMACAGPITLWLAVAAGYIIRYKPHIEAGLADKN